MRLLKYMPRDSVYCSCLTLNRTQPMTSLPSASLISYSGTSKLSGAGPLRIRPAVTDMSESTRRSKEKQRTDVVVRTVARAEPASVVTRLANGYTTQVSANAKHDKPLRLLRTRFIGFGVAQGLPVDRARLVDLRLSTVTNEDRLAASLDDDVRALGNGAQVDLDLGESENVRRGGHARQEFGNSRLRD